MIKKIFHQEKQKAKKYQKRKFWALAFFLVAILISGYFLYNWKKGLSRGSDQKATVYPESFRAIQRFFNIFDEPKIDGPANLFKLNDLEGHEFDLGAPREKRFLLLVFEGTNCPSCVALEKDLKEVSAKFDNDLDAVTISVERNEEKNSRYVKEYEVNRRWLIDETLRVSLAYRVESVPALFLLDQENNFQFIGYEDFSMEDLEKAILFE